MKSLDLLVLGGGPGGYVAAIRGSQLGLKTAIIEKDALGGVCLNWGCIPTKALLKNADVLNTIKNAGKFGITVSDYSVDWNKTIKRSRQVSERLSKGVEYLMKKNKVAQVHGTAALEGKNKVVVTSDNTKETFTAKKIIIATGARPNTVPGVEIDGKQIIGSREAMTLEKIPGKLVIIGAGAIGVEFAYFYNTYGSDVTILEMLPRILPVEDEEISRELEKSFLKSRITVSTGAKVTRIEKLEKKVKVHYTGSDGKNQIIECDLVLAATGVRGNIENIGLETLKINTDQNSIVIDEFCRTNVEGYYAIGDVTGPPWLAHVASAQGYIAAEHAAGLEPDPVNYSHVPGCTYCRPQVGSMGYTEEKAQEEGRKTRVGYFHFRANGKSLAQGDSSGFVKLIFDNQYGELIGAHIIGAEATEMIAELSLAKALESTWEEIAGTVHAHPTLSEAIMEAALAAGGQPIHQ